MTLLMALINQNIIGIDLFFSENILLDVYFFGTGLMVIVEFITNLPDLIGNAVQANEWIGYSAILVAMFLENLFPPIPSELIMPLGGFYVQQGQLHFLPVVIAGLLGTLLGAFPWYGIGRLINEERIEVWLSKYGRWLGIS